MKNFIFPFLFIFLTTCVGNNQYDEVIDLDRQDEISIFNFTDSVCVIPLETTLQSLMAGIDNVLYHAGRYYVLDQQQQIVLCFDQQGRFLFKIARKGQGPEEYAYVANIGIDVYNQQLLIINPFGEILCFNLDGEFISKIKIPDAGSINEVHALDADRLLLGSLNIDNKLYYTRSTDSIVKRLYPNETIPTPLWPLDRTYTYNGSAYFSLPLENEVLNMSGENPEVAFFWNFGAKNNTSQQKADLLKYLQEVNARPPQQRIYFTKHLLEQTDYLNYYIWYTQESNRYRIALVEYKGEYLHVFIDKKEHCSFVFKITAEGLKVPHYRHFFGEQIIFSQMIFEEQDMSNSIKQTLSPSQFKIVESHNPETDNPFLVVYHLKQ